VVCIPGIAHALPPGEPCQEVVDLLRAWLAAAEAGEFHGILLAGVKAGGGSRSEWAGVASMDASLAAASALYGRVMAAYLSCVEFPDCG
jgi:hypothetical protein